MQRPISGNCPRKSKCHRPRADPCCRLTNLILSENGSYAAPLLWALRALMLDNRKAVNLFSRMGQGNDPTSARLRHGRIPSAAWALALHRQSTWPRPLGKKGARLVGASRALRRGAQPPLTIPEIRCDYFAPNIQLQPIHSHDGAHASGGLCHPPVSRSRALECRVTRWPEPRP